jgi:hypothetical protein
LAMEGITSNEDYICAEKLSDRDGKHGVHGLLKHPIVTCPLLVISHLSSISAGLRKSHEETPWRCFRNRLF